MDALLLYTGLKDGEHFVGIVMSKTMGSQRAAWHG